MIKKIYMAILAITIITLVSCDNHTSTAEKAVVEYSVTFPNAEDHYINVELKIGNIQDTVIDLRMPVWATGYYIILDSPKHLTDFSATDANGAPLKWTKPLKNSWLVKNGSANEIVVKYRIFANNKSVGEANVDTERAFLATNEVFLFINDRINTPSTIKITPWHGWSKISTGLERVAGATNTFYAKDFDVLFDSPIFIGNQMTINFRHEDKDFEICVARPQGLDTARFVADFKKIVTAAKDIIGDIPYNNYALIMMEPGGGGLEHTNSQAIFTDSDLSFPNPGAYNNFMNFVAHEYFHLYNVKTIRPIELGPFNYNGECYTESLWVSEGLTCFYENVLMKMAGLSDARTILNYVTDNLKAYEPYLGKKRMSLAQSSTDIWLNFFNRDANGQDVRISYYTKGPVIGLLLDIAIRQASNNQHSCDDVMRALYNRYYKDAGRGFTPEEFWSICEEYSGSDLSEIKSYVYTTCDVDYEKYFNYAGLTMDRETYRIDTLAETSPEQKAIRKAIIGE